MARRYKVLFLFFCECIQHLFFDYHFAKFVWRIVHVSFNLLPPTSVHNLFTGWLDGINRKLKSKILVGASAICWTIWLTQNDIIFDKAVAPSYLQVIFRGPIGPRPGPYFRRRRIANWWKWDAEILRQPQWRCLQDTVGDLVIKLLYRCQSLKAFHSFSLVQNFVFEIAWTAVVVFVIKNTYMHWTMQKLGYSYILFSKNKV